MTDLRIMTFNIRHGVGMDGRLALDRVLTEIEDQVPAVACLQEVDRRVWRSRFRRQDKWLARRLGMASAYGASDRAGIVGRAGNALLVGGTVASTEVIELPKARTGPPRSALSAEVVVDGVAVRVVVAHLGVAYDDATRQLEALLNWTRRLAPPVILAGDLNLSTGGVRSIIGGHGFALAVASATFPARAPRVQIDHVAIRGGAVSSTSVGRQLASDHRCLVADLSW